MDRKQDFVEVGRIIRSHGLAGMVKIRFANVNPEILYKMDLFYLQNDRGDLYPVRLQECRPDNNSPNLFFVQFENISDRSAAERIKDHAVFLESRHVPVLQSEPDSEFDDLIDCEVLDQNNNSVGLVTDVILSPAHPILVVSSPEGKMMIPYVDHFIEDADDEIIWCINLDELEGL